jgi:cobalt-zinc-cadmium efflux system protein
LLISLGAVAYEAILRIGHPHPIEGRVVALVAGIGIIINSATALLFLKDKENDLNSKGAYLHMASDAVISFGVVIAGIVIIYTGWFWLDSVVSLTLVIVVVFGTWDLLKESLKLTLNGVPKDINITEVKTYLLSLKGVIDVHDLHIWAISTTETALTVHLVISERIENDLIYQSLKEELHHKFHISHTTIQIEHNQKKFNCEQKC